MPPPALLLLPFLFIARSRAALDFPGQTVEGPPAFGGSRDDDAFTGSLTPFRERVHVDPREIAYFESEGELQASAYSGCVAVLPDDAFLLHNLAELFFDEPHVLVATCRDCAPWIIYPRVIRDRSCLSINHSSRPSPETIPFLSRTHLSALVESVNQVCQTYRAVNGTLNSAGETRDRLLRQAQAASEASTCAEAQAGSLSPIEFLRNFAAISKPVVIRDGASHWPAMRQWNDSYFLQRFYGRSVHVKLAPNGDFEGCSQAKEFAAFSTFKIPKHVRAQLNYPDLVVVRPASREMQFEDFLAFLDRQSLNDTEWISAYLEYSSVEANFPELKRDVVEPPFLREFLRKSHFNLWFSDGRTLGRLHFDPYDNFLAQVFGPLT